MAAIMTYMFLIQPIEHFKEYTHSVLREHVISDVHIIQLDILGVWAVVKASF